MEGFSSDFFLKFSSILCDCVLESRNLDSLNKNVPKY